MTWTEKILAFAENNGGRFTRQEIVEFVRQDESPLSPATLGVTLSRMAESNRIVRVAHGVYELPSSHKAAFMYKSGDKELEIIGVLAKSFPGKEYCVWRSAVYASFSPVKPPMEVLFVEVDRTIMDDVFEVLKTIVQGNPLFLDPSDDVLDRYFFNSEQIFIRPMIVESPVSISEHGYCVPTLEKLLVDAMKDARIMALKPRDINTFYHKAFSAYAINKNRLLRYASRRNRKDKVKEVLDLLGY